MYGKIFASIYKGSMRGKADPQAVLIYMIANCDKEGHLDEAHQGIAEAIGRPVDAVKEACLFLEAADPESRSTDEGGARIVRVAPPRSWGWRIVNHAKYVAIRNEEDRRAQNREAAKKYRGRASGDDASSTVINRHHASSRVSTRQQPSAESAHADTDTDANTEGEFEAADAATPTPYRKDFSPLLAVLRSQGLPATDEVAAEWASLGGGRAGCASRNEVLEFVGYAVKRGLADGVDVKYPRQAALYADAWKRRSA